MLHIFLDHGLNTFYGQKKTKNLEVMYFNVLDVFKYTFQLPVNV